MVNNHFGGDIPLQKEILMTLPGVGKYIASAVICFGLNRPEPVLDTNTVRILGRVCRIEITDSSRRSKKFEELMRGFIGIDVPREISFFMIDLGAKICRPKYPKCEICPINDFCDFAKEKRSDLNAR
jgi:A/G-specific adenine glycosylase